MKLQLYSKRVQTVDWKQQYNKMNSFSLMVPLISDWKGLFCEYWKSGMHVPLFQSLILVISISSGQNIKSENRQTRISSVKAHLHAIFFRKQLSATLYMG